MLLVSSSIAIYHFKDVNTSFVMDQLHISIGGSPDGHFMDMRLVGEGMLKRVARRETVLFEFFFALQHH